jgi:hypothetical protein
MDAQVIINGVDVSNYLLSINRDYNYCEISQSFTLRFPLGLISATPNQTVVIYEVGTKVLTGYVTSLANNAPDGTLTVIGQDKYKLATSYFLEDTYTTGFGQTVRHWVEFLLDLVGLTATFPSGNGPYVAEGQEIGLDSISNVIETFIQYAGWYGKCDENGDLSFGKLGRPSTGVILESGVNLLDIEYDKSYDKTRNSAFIFGGVDPDVDQFRPIFASYRKDLDFLLKDQTVVVGNPMIGQQEAAERFARVLVDNLGIMTYIKTVSVLGNPDIEAGKYITVISDLFSGEALVTRMDSHLSEEGYTMQLVLDDFCPRLVAHTEREQNIYAGTWGSGVWRYNLYDDYWTNISSGLTDNKIVDLSVDEGLFIASTPSGLYTKIGTGLWEYQTLPSVSGIASGVRTYPGVYVDSINQEFNAIMTISGNWYDTSYFYTGVIGSGNTISWSGTPIVSDIDRRLDGRYYRTFDMEGYGSAKYIVAEHLGNAFHHELIVYEDRNTNTINTVSPRTRLINIVYEYESGEYGYNYTLSGDLTKIVFTGYLNMSGDYYNDNVYLINVDGTGLLELYNAADYPDADGQFDLATFNYDGTKLLMTWMSWDEICRWH